MKLSSSNAHLAYCTNIHPAETWEETFQVLKTHTLSVRDKLTKEPFAIGLRLSAQAAEELLKEDHLPLFKKWLEKENCYIFTINGFPYGAFHGTCVKEEVYRPDWTSLDRLDYTNNLFAILAELLPEGVDGSVSTLPGSFKAFEADENILFANLYACSLFIETLSAKFERDLHLGLEPEPLGHFENLEETVTFFFRFTEWAEQRKLDTSFIHRRIGINFDTCHFAIEFEDCRQSLEALRAAGIRISKVHLSNALSFTPGNPYAINALKNYEDSTYLHQVILKDTKGYLTRFKDLPDFLTTIQSPLFIIRPEDEGRVHFHIPLYAEPAPPLSSTAHQAASALSYLKQYPDYCTHFEIETYTWEVLPDDLQTPIHEQIANEYAWVLERL